MFDETDKKICTKYFSDAYKENIPAADLLLSTHLHPHGIKEMLEPRQARIAKSILVLFSALEKDSVEERLSALHSMRDELMFCADNSMSMNTSRVLLSVVKELVRERDCERKLELLHDFTELTTGRPSLVRKYLKKYNLLEMPEEWNQASFDYHVHDSYTTGRKTPTHLIMDAAVKGIRGLTVIYYTLPPVDAVRELFTAAYYMRMTVHIGIEFSVRFREKEVKIIWEPKDIADEEAYSHFTLRAGVKKIAKLAEEACRYRTDKVFAKIEGFNSCSLKEFNNFYGIKSKPFSLKEFSLYTGKSVPSIEILSGFICRKTYPLIRDRLENLKKSGKEVEFKRYLQRVHSFSSEFVSKTFFRFCEFDADLTKHSGKNIPELMEMPPEKLINLIENGYSSNNFTLNLGGLSLSDVLEIIYNCNGKISYFEIYNYRNISDGRMPDAAKIEQLEQCINNRYVSELIHLIKKDCLEPLEKKESDDKREDRRISRKNIQSESIKNIMDHIEDLFNYYQIQKMGDRWGSDSTGWSSRCFGAGFVLLETLPYPARKEVLKNQEDRMLPVSLKAVYQKVYGNVKFSETLPDMLKFGRKKIVWVPEKNSTIGGHPNLIALGKNNPANPDRTDNFFIAYEKDSGKKRKKGGRLEYLWHYMPTNIKNWSKIITGFIPAFLTFFLTNDWTFLMYFGAVLWFAITGVRNIFQAILGGDSLKHSHLLHWKNYIDWSRISDSLFFSGWSVPLLDYLVKTVLLYQGFGVSIAVNPWIVYSVMSVLNGIYIVSHNILRGFDRRTTFINFFRSIIAIPVAYTISTAAGGILMIAGVEGIDFILQKWAAIIIKIAGDLVGGLIEGAGLHRKNVGLRMIDYRTKILRFEKTCSAVELLYAEDEIATKFSNIKKFFHDLQKKNPKLLNLLVYDSLDFLYFWEYQPYSRPVLRKTFLRFSEKQKKDFIFYQQILKDKKMIKNLMEDGLLGKNYTKPNQFFLRSEGLLLSKADKYLTALQNIK